MKIKFLRFHPEVKIPQRKHASDTGADIFMLEDGCIFNGETKVIPLGFGIEVPNGHSARLQVRTSIAKQGVMIQGCAIDAGYKGEIHMILHNINQALTISSHEYRSEFVWKKGDRLGYIEVYPCQYPSFVEDELTERGDGAFGSSGR